MSASIIGSDEVQLGMARKQKYKDLNIKFTCDISSRFSKRCLNTMSCFYTRYSVEYDTSQKLLMSLNN